MSKCDLHIHSRFSARSEEWLFRRLDFPDSYSDPRELHRQLVERGMNFVTITDHDTIDGCLADPRFAEHVYQRASHDLFPARSVQDSHFGLGNHRSSNTRISSIVRDNIFALQRYLQGANIAHAVAHPLYSINGKLEATHLERLILLFKHFEGINGLRDALLSELAQHLFGSLTPEKIEDFADRHNLAPTHPEPWKKIFVGGSDDHGGQFFASAYTETPRASSAEKFLDHIRSGQLPARTATAELPSPCPTDSTTRSAVSFRTGSTKSSDPSAALVEQMFSRFMEGRDPTELTLKDKARFSRKAVVSGKIFDLMKPANVSLWKELSSYFAGRAGKSEECGRTGGVVEPERRTFMMANMVAEQLAFRFFQKFVQQLSSGNMLESMQALSAIAPILVVLAPYIYGFHSQAPSRKWLRSIFRELTGEIPGRVCKTTSGLVHRHTRGRQRRRHHDSENDRGRRCCRKATDRRHFAERAQRSTISRSRISNRSASLNCPSTSCRN